MSNIKEISIDPLTSLQAKLSQELKLEQQVPMYVVEKAQRDPSYLYHLLSSKNNPIWLRMLFNKAYEDFIADKHDIKKPKVKEIATEFSSSLLRWSMSGFKQSDHNVFLKRWNACKDCPHLIQPPANRLYHLGRRIISSNSDQRICNLCGCFAHKKCNIATESCPDSHPTLKGLTRWSEPKKIKI